jgi:hypothetical protein
MRLHKVPAPRIAEALAEVHNHLTETGENPHDAFGDPTSYARSYANRLSNAQGGDGRHGWGLGLLGSVMLREWVLALVLCLGNSLFIGGFVGIVTGGEAFLGLPKVASAMVGLVVFATVAVRLFGRPVTPSPSTGKDATGSVPVWIIGAMMSVPCGTLLLTLLLVAASR